ncbi:MAG: DUF6531 domain-containing protein [Butyrivibrio sp.]|nr:DUF6531 domain-containing protein [Butyrivibrio sp.]
MGFTKENLYTNIPGAGNVFTAGDQIWDQTEIKNFFDLVISQLYVFEGKSEVLVDYLNAYINDYFHQGTEASASKDFAGNTYMPVIVDTVRSVQILKAMMEIPGFEGYTPILNAFKDDLEENDEAIFTKSKFDQIIIDFSSYNRCFAENTPTITSYRNTAQAIIESCDAIKSIKNLDEPDPAPAQEELDEFVTGDGQDGDIPILRKLFLNFLDAHNDDFSNSEFVGLIDKIIANLNRINEGLGDGIYEPGTYNDKLAAIEYEAGGDTEEYKAYIETYGKYIEGEATGSQVYAYDPVNMNSGSFVSTKTDLVIAGIHGLDLKRSYNSKKDRSGILGTGWTLNFEERLTRDDEDTITLYFGDGKVGCFKKTTLGKDEVYLEIHGEEGVLCETENGYRLTHANNKYTEYDSEGYLVNYGDSYGNHTIVDYNVFEKTVDGKEVSTTLPIRVSTKEGRSISFIYNKNGILIKAIDHTGREVSYSYSEENGSCRLTSITAPDGSVRSYTYTADGMIRSCTRADGVVGITNEYDSQKRVVHQTTADGLEFTYSYNDKDHVTSVTEPSGCKVEYVADDAGRHVATRYPEFGVQDSYTYNEKGLKISHTDRRGLTTRYTYDNRGHVTGIIGPEGLHECYTYNADGKLISRKDSEGNTITYKYDLDGNLYSMTDHLGEKTRYDYEGGRLVAMRDADGGKTEYTYDDKGNIASVTDPAGVVTRYYYDDLGRVIATEDAEGNRTTYELDVNGNILLSTDPEGNETRYSYTALGKVSDVMKPDGTRKHWDYNIAGKKSAYTDEESRTTRFFYNTLYQEEKIILPNNGTVSYEYDKLGNCLAEVDAEGNRTEYTYDKGGNRTSTMKVVKDGAEKKKVTVMSAVYDGRGRIVSETDAEGNTTSYSYDKNSNMIERLDAAGGKTSYEYDAAGRLVKTIDPLGRETLLTYTKDGKLKSSKDYAGVITHNIYEDGRVKRVVKQAGEKEMLVKEYEYDACGRVCKITEADGLTVTHTFDKVGRIKDTVVSDGRHLTYSYDACGRVTEFTESGNTTRYTYTGTGKLRSVTDALGNVTEYTYDELDLLETIVGSADHVTAYKRDLTGNIVSVTDGLGQKDVYTYDEFGWVKTHIDRDGYETSYTRDYKGNVTGVDYSDGKSVRLSYSALGKLEEIRDHLGVTKIVNDIAGRMISATDYSGRTVGYEYGPDNKRTAVIYPDGKVARYNYDEFGRLISLSDDAEGNGVTETVNYTYDELGRLSSKAFPNGTSVLYDYYPGGNIKTLTSKDNEGVIDKYEYHYNAAVRDRITRERRGLDAVSGTYEYAFDALGRIISTSFDGALKTSYAYDAFGNRVSMTEGSAVTEYQYDALNRLTASIMTSPETAEVNTTYGYDKRGNLVALSVDGIVQKSFEYDAAGMMVRAHDNNMGEASYDYNGLGYRVRCVRPEEETEYMCDLSREYYNLLERTVNGEKQSFVYDKNVVSMQNKEGNFYYLQDELGSTMYLTGTDGLTVDSFAYDDFGRRLDPITGRKQDERHGYSKEGNILQPFAFTGYQEDSVTGLSFAQARYYNSEVGRFTAEDQFKGSANKPATQNRYAYCWNNPIRYVDLDGKTPIDDPVKDAEAAQEIQDALDSKVDVPDVFLEHMDEDKDSVNQAGTNTTPGCLSDTMDNGSGDGEYVAAVYLLARDGAAGQGHAAVALVKDDGTCDVFSIGGGYNSDWNGGPIEGYFGTTVDENGNQTSMNFQDLLNTGNIIHDNHGSRDENKADPYSHFIYIPITNEEGKEMYDRAMGLRNEYIADYSDPNQYYYLRRRGTNAYGVMDNNCGQNVMIVLGDKYAFAHPYMIDNWWRSKPNVQYQDGIWQIENGYMNGCYYGTIDQLRMAFCEV